MLSDLQSSLREFMGRAITPEIAARLYAAAAFQPDEHINPGLFSEELFQGYVIRVELLADIIKEIHPLHLLHWEETEKYREGVAMSTDYEPLLTAERAGKMLQFVVRHNGALVGNLRLYLFKSAHTGLLSASEDTLFIHPEHRIPWLALRLMRYAERALRACGVHDYTVDSKLANGSDALMRRIMGKPVALTFHKNLVERSSNGA